MGRLHFEAVSFSLSMWKCEQLKMARDWHKLGCNEPGVIMILESALLHFDNPHCLSVGSSKAYTSFLSSELAKAAIHSAGVPLSDYDGAKRVRPL